MRNEERGTRNEEAAWIDHACGLNDFLLPHSSFLVRYSYLSATAGSTFAARRAGTYEATRPTVNRTSEIPM